MLNEVGEDEEEIEEEQDDYLNNSEIENHYQLKKEIQKRLQLDELENTSDYEDNGGVAAYKNIYTKRNSNSTNDNTDEDYDDTDEIHVDGLVSKLKSKRVKELEAQLTRDQLEEEKRYVLKEEIIYLSLFS